MISILYNSLTTILFLSADVSFGSLENETRLKMFFLIMILLSAVCARENLRSTNNVIKFKDVFTEARSAKISYTCPTLSKCQQKLLVEVLCLSEWCDKKPINTFKIQKSDINISRLKPFTNYRITVSLLNSIEFKTKPSAPGAVSELEAYSKNENAISLRWKPPYPPTGVLEGYQLTYLIEENVSNNLETVKNISVTSCYLWPDYHCSNLTDLEAKKNYSVNLSAKNKKWEYYGCRTNVIVFTQKEPPEAPYDLSQNWTENNLILNWKHPFRSNGDIQYFYITLIPEGDEIKSNFTVNVSGSCVRYYYKIDANYLQPSKRYRLTISANNGYSGKEAVINVTTYPTKPFADVTPKIRYEENKTISVEVLLKNLTKLNENNVNSDRLFLLMKQQNACNPEREKLPSLLQNSYLNLTEFETICDFEIKNSTFYFKIGASNTSDPNCLDNISLQTDSTYNVTVVLSRTFENKTKFKLYSKNVYIPDLRPVQTVQETEQNTILETDKWDGHISLSQIIIPVVIIITLIIILSVLWIKKSSWNNESGCKSMFCRRVSNNVPLPHEEALLTLKDGIENNKSDEILLYTQEAIKIQRYGDDKNNPINVELENEEYFSKPIELEKLKKYVDMSARRGDIENEFKMFVEKTPKTVYETLDHQLFEYIDLVYDDGTVISKAYVATKVPIADNIQNFWKQIFEDNIQLVVLLGEVGSKELQYKYQQYWPEENEKMVYQDISVQQIYSKSYSYYTIRKFVLIVDETTKQIDQIHCPYSGSNPLKLAPFVEKLVQLQLKNNNSSVLVHSSTEIGGVGTVLLCSLSLRLAHNEKTIDVLKGMHVLRKHKPGFIRNAEQYKLIYQTISHVLFPHEDENSELNDYANF